MGDEGPQHRRAEDPRGRTDASHQRGHAAEDEPTGGGASAATAGEHSVYASPAIELDSGSTGAQEL